MERQRLIEIIKSTTEAAQNCSENEFDEIYNQIQLEHLKSLRPFCNSLAQIGLAVIEQAQDTLWVTNHETVVDRIFNELGIDLINDPKEQLIEFLNYEVELWLEKRLVKKNELPVQLELNLES